MPLRRVRGVLPRASLVAGLTALALAGGAAPASAAGKVVKVSVAPGKPVTTTSRIVLSFPSGRSLGKHAQYVGTLDVDSPPPLRRCAAGPLEARSRRAVRKGTRVALTFVPTDRWSTGRWCPGTVRLTLEIATTDSTGTETLTKVRASAAATITQDAGVPAPVIVYTPARLTLLDPSTMTISAPGHADRTSVLTGVLAARKPGRLILNADYDFTVVSGTIAATAPVADPLCSPDPDPWPATFAPQPDVSTALLRVNGTAAYSYELPIDAARLTGCRGHGTGATTTVALTGKLDVHKLTRLPLSGTVSGITLADGTAATVTFNVLVRVEILDENQVP